MKRAIIATVLAAAVLSTPAVAEDHSAGVITKTIGHSLIQYERGRAILHSPGARGFHAAPLTHDGLTTIFNNFATAYPDSLYFCCESLLNVGPEGLPGIFPETWGAAAFTPTSNITLKEIDLPLDYLQGTNAVVVALYDDNANFPGNVIKTFHVEDMLVASACCGLTVLKDRKGTPLIAGKQYWIALTTNKHSADAMIGWNMNTTEQITMIREAAYCSDDVAHSGVCGTSNDTWSLDNGVPEVAFAVYGK